jgi:hypothetical protein
MMTVNSRLFLVTAAILLAASPMDAAIQRTFVSTQGSDANPCSRDLPCRNFDPAIAQTLTGGEVVVLDSGGYGRITLINKSISVIAPIGVHAAISVLTGDGVTINTRAGSVLLHNIFLTGLGGYTGINVQDVTSLTLENIQVTGFAGDGLYFAPVGDSNVIIADSVFRRNGGTGADVVGNTPDIYSKGHVLRSRFEANTVNGLAVVRNSKVAVEDSSAMDNGDTGFALITYSPGTWNALSSLERCSSLHNGTGVKGTFGGSGLCLFVVSNSTIAYNNIALVVPNGGEIFSRGNNTVWRNNANTTFSNAFAPQ